MQLFSGQIHLNDGQVAVGVCTDDFAFDHRVVPEDDLHFIGSFHHVVVGHDVALLIPDKARPLSFLVEFIGCEECCWLFHPFDHPDVDHGWIDALVEIDE